MFGVQYYGECWSDLRSESRFYMYGASSNCYHGVGKELANMVYLISGIRLSNLPFVPVLSLPERVLL